MTDDAIKQAVAALLCALEFRTEDAAHAIDAMAEAYKQIRQAGGGIRQLNLSMSRIGGHKLIAHSPEIVVSKVVHRRKVS